MSMPTNRYCMYDSIEDPKRDRFLTLIAPRDSEQFVKVLLAGPRKKKQSTEKKMLGPVPRSHWPNRIPGKTP